jgi:hypothetical protein
LAVKSWKIRLERHIAGELGRFNQYQLWLYRRRSSSSYYWRWLLCCICIGENPAAEILSAASPQGRHNKQKNGFIHYMTPIDHKFQSSAIAPCPHFIIRVINSRFLLV